MKDVMIYILKSGICLSAILIVYQLFLRKTTFFKFNRAYLLMGIILSLIVPAINYSYNVAVAQTESIMPMANNATIELNPTRKIDAWFVISFLYIIGVAIIIGRSIFSYRKLYNLLKQGTKVKQGDYSFIDNPKVESPFSVFTYIVLNSKKLTTKEKDIILKHEKTHINQHHWLDLLLSELMLAFQWFNPACWAYVKMQKENHEFLADKAVIDAGTSAAVYQAVLLNQQFGGPVFSFTNSFYFSNKLNRLDMMKKTKSAPWKRIAVLAVLPVLGMFVWASATPNYVTVEPEIPDSLLYIVDKQEISNAEFKKIANKDVDSMWVLKKDLAVEQFGERGKNGVIIIKTKKNTSRLMQYDVLYIIDGKKATKADLDKLDEGNIATWRLLKDKEATEKYGAKAKKGAIEIETKKK